MKTVSELEKYCDELIDKNIDLKNELDRKKNDKPKIKIQIDDAKIVINCGGKNG